MRAGWIAPGGFDRSGERHVIPVFLGILQRLAAEQDCHVFALQQGARAESFPLLGAIIHEMGGASRSDRGLPLLRRTLRAVSAEHRRSRFDVLHGLWANQSGFAAAVAGRLLKVPVVVTVAGGEMVRLPEIGYGGALTLRGRIQVRWTLRLATAVTGATNHALAPVKRQRPDAILLPLGVDLSLFEAPAGAQSSSCKLLQISHLNHVKDQPTLLRAFRRIVDEVPDATLEIIGEDTLGGEIQKLAGGMFPDGRVTFRGAQPSREVAASLRTAQLLLHTSRHECGQVAYLEAAAAGVPTVGTSVGYVADLAPEAAVAAPVGDDVGLAEASLRLLRNSALRETIAGRARLFAEEHDADWTVGRLQEIYARTNW